jgi:DNA-binding MarR family transcriptional regulator
MSTGTAATSVRTQRLVDQILDQLEPLITLQRQAIARQGCLRAASSTQLHVLFLLACNESLPMSRLAELLDVSLPNVTGIVDRMVEHGLAERTRDDQDRRLVLLSATDAGRAMVEEIDLVRRKRLADVLDRMQPDQLERALHTFRELRAAIEAAALETDGPPA